LLVTPQQFSIRLPPSPESVRQARRQVGKTLREAGRADWVDDAVLAVSEVVTNVVLHAHTDCELSVEVSSLSVRISVRDFTPELPALRHFTEYATTGRGLGLVARLSAGFGIDPLGDDGKVVWFLLDGRSPAVDADAFAAEWDVSELLAPQEWRDEPGEAVLRHVPMALWLAGLEHQAAVLRELYLVQASHPGIALAEHDAPADGRLDLIGASAGLRALHEATDRAIAAAAEGPSLPRLAPLPPGHPSALPEVPAVLDLGVSVQTVGSGAFGALQDVLEEGQRLAYAGYLLVRPALEELIALRDWACDQVVAQSTGVPPTGWDESITRHPEAAAGYRLPDWDDAPVRTSPRAVVAADDSNRLIAVSPSAAELLGGAPEDLVGQRITTIIPPRLREQHVAGFTRHLTTGQARAIGVELHLPVLRLDGEEVLRRFFIEQIAAPAGRRIYLAWLDPLPPS
jgi:PAS domain S-box-containing protein